LATNFISLTTLYGQGVIIKFLEESHKVDILPFAMSNSFFILLWHYSLCNVHQHIFIRI